MDATTSELRRLEETRRELRDSYKRKTHLLEMHSGRLDKIPLGHPDFTRHADECGRLLADLRAINAKLAGTLPV